MRVEQMAAQKGYSITPEGEAIGPRGRQKTSPDSKGYLRFGVMADGKQKHCPVHRLQAFQKFGMAMFERGIDVRHLDGNPKNNSAGNIAIGTRSENLRDSVPEKRRETARKRWEATPAEERTRRAKESRRTMHGAMWAKLQRAFARGMNRQQAANYAGCTWASANAFAKRNNLNTRKS